MTPTATPNAALTAPLDEQTARQRADKYNRQAKHYTYTARRIGKTNRWEVVATKRNR